jgi:hypothetical protein
MKPLAEQEFRAALNCTDGEAKRLSVRVLGRRP